MVVSSIYCYVLTHQLNLVSHVYILIVLCVDIYDTACCVLWDCFDHVTGMRLCLEIVLALFVSMYILLDFILIRICICVYYLLNV